MADTPENDNYIALEPKEAPGPATQAAAAAEDTSSSDSSSSSSSDDSSSDESEDSEAEEKVSSKKQKKSAQGKEVDVQADEEMADVVEPTAEVVQKEADANPLLEATEAVTEADQPPVDESKDKKKSKKSKKPKSEDAEEGHAQEPLIEEVADEEAKDKKTKKDKKSKKSKSETADVEEVVEEAEDVTESKAEKKKRKREAEADEINNTAVEADDSKEKKRKKKDKKANNSVDVEAKEQTNNAQDQEKTTGAEQWNVSALGGGATRQAKFMKLLGGKKSVDAGTDSSAGTSKQHIEHMQDDLERQFEAGMRKKDLGGKRGLGA